MPGLLRTIFCGQLVLSALMMAGDARASFLLDCELQASVIEFHVIATHSGPADITAKLRIIRARKIRGHVKENDCNMKSGQTITISTVISAAERESAAAYGRELSKEFKPGAINPNNIGPDDRLKLRYEFMNGDLGDTHTWTLLKHKPAGRMGWPF